MQDVMLPWRQCELAVGCTWALFFIIYICLRCAKLHHEPLVVSCFCLCCDHKLYWTNLTLKKTKNMLNIRQKLLQGAYLINIYFKADLQYWCLVIAPKSTSHIESGKMCIMSVHSELMASWLSGEWICLSVLQCPTTLQHQISVCLFLIEINLDRCCPPSIGMNGVTSLCCL